MSQGDDRSQVQELYQNFLHTRQEYSSSAVQYASQLTSDDLTSYQRAADGLMREMGQLQNQVEHYLRTADTDHEDSRSGSGGKSGGGCSSRSHASLMRLKEDQKKAALNGKAKIIREEYELKKKQRQLEIERHHRAEELAASLRQQQQQLDEDLELSRLEFEQMREELNIKKELAVSEAKAEVLDQFEYGSETHPLVIPESEDRVSDKVQNWKVDPSCRNEDEYRKDVCDGNKMDLLPQPANPTNSTPGLLNPRASPFRPSVSQVQQPLLRNPYSRASEGRQEQSDLSHLADLLVSRQGSPKSGTGGLQWRYIEISPVDQLF